MACFYTEGDRQAVIFLLKSVNFDNVNAVSKTDQIQTFPGNYYRNLLFWGIIIS
jgi:hypothetical protein